MKDYSAFEKPFDSRKQQRNERKLCQQKDRSKFKKSDQNKEEILKRPDNSKRGRVITISTGMIKVLVEGEIISSGLKGSLKKEVTLNKNLVTVGDFVWIDERGQIAGVEKRYSCLSRADALHQRKQHLIAANIDQVLIVASIENPSLKPSLLDRYIIATERGGMKPVIIINKIDLAKDLTIVNELEEIYKALEIPFLKVSALHEIGIDTLKEIVKGKSSVFSGQSGVGKTSLINDLTGQTRKVGSVVQKTGKGSHTTTHAELISIGENALCIDTPGIKSFALWDITTEELTSYFSDLQKFSENCKYTPCSHTHEPGCAVKEAASCGKLSQIRYNSYLAIREGHDEPNSLR
jgi:ribosome biogenesis GTPase